MTALMADRPQASDPIQYWNGPAGLRWVTAQEQLDRLLAPFQEALLAHARPAPGERAVDVGCGCGATTLAVAAAVAPGGAALGLDVSAPMLARARERAVGLAAATFVEADAATHRLDPPADLLVSRFGVMFFADPGAAIANLLRLLQPGGRLAFVCWRALEENPWASIPFAAASGALGVAAPLDAEGPGPFAFADAARVRRLLQAAGFEAITVDPVDREMVLGSDLEEAVTFASFGGPTARLLAGVDEASRARAEGAVREALAPHARAGGVALGGAAWLVGARRP
jgi:SAM-dependent methyltransferase